MRLALWAAVVCLHVCARCQDPKDEVEIMPEAVEKERKKMTLFWAIMYEVCRTFCVWKTFCQSFCSKLNPDQRPHFDMSFDMSFELLVEPPVSSTVWLYSTVADICDEDAACVESCLNLQPDDDQPWPEQAPPTNILRALYELAVGYFARCAADNGRPTTAVDAFTVERFCREITSASREFTRHCVASLAK